MANRRSSRGTIEEGYIVFQGETSKTVTLVQAPYGMPQISITAIETWDHDEDGDIDSDDYTGRWRYHQIDNDLNVNAMTLSAEIGLCVTNQSFSQFTIHLTAPFHGRVNYIATS